MNNSKQDLNTEATSFELQRYRMNNSEWDIVHHSYQIERMATSLFINGDEKDIIDLWDNFPKDTIGKMAHSPLKQEEYTAVLLITLCVRIAIEVGLDEYKAYAINDLYLQKISVATSIEQYRQLTKDGIHMIYISLSDVRNKKSRIAAIEKAKQYVEANISKKFSLSDIASYAGLSPNRLSAVFSKQENMSLKKYILNERINVAKNMLKYSNDNICIIAEYLCFSSQSHFGKIFKQYTGMTPMAFRNKYNII